MKRRSSDPLPIDVARIAPSTFVGEVVMKTEMTAFLEAARARGCRYQIGTDMLFEQIPAYLEYFGFPSTTPEVLRQTTGNLELFTEQYKVGRRSLLELVSQYDAYARLERDQASLRYDIALLQLEIARDRGLLVDGARM